MTTTFDDLVTKHRIKRRRRCLNRLADLHVGLEHAILDKVIPEAAGAAFISRVNDLSEKPGLTMQQVIGLTDTIQEEANAEHRRQQNGGTPPEGEFTGFKLN